MKIISILTLTTCIFLISCKGESKSDEKVVDDGNVMSTAKLDSCDCKDLQTDTLGNHFLKDEAFTGICLDYYPGSDEKYIEKNLLEGKLHGKVIYYAKGGDILMEEVYESGNKKRSGEVEDLVCNCDELEKKSHPDPLLPVRFMLDEIPFSGKCEQFYPESDQLYLEAQYNDGLLDGYSIYYDREGTTLYMEEYSKGTLLKTVYEGN
ncbi:MAG: hypothetical protein MI810_03750 [Flavobacteriales bacterium]|jgi:hypothetical protein|nr:hypothetical protein [Flavobacteriales bacterium]